MDRMALTLSGSGPLTTSGTTTALVMPTVGRDGLANAGTLNVSITNPTASTKTITSGSVVFTDTVGAGTATITYPLPGTVSIAAGANANFTIPLSSGYLLNCTLNVTFGANPSAGTL